MFAIIVCKLFFNYEKIGYKFHIEFIYHIKCDITALEQLLIKILEQLRM